MIWSLLGARGRGKTLAMTYMGKRAKRNRWIVYSNYHTKFSEYMKTSAMIESFGRFKNCYLLIDEGQVFFSNRAWKEKHHEDFSRVLQLSRKNNVHVVITSQNFSNLDIKIRQQIDFFGFPQMLGKFCKIKWYDASWIEEGLETRLFTEYFSIDYVKDDYDTKEVPI